MSQCRVVPLRGVVQHYHWGGTEFIPKLLGVSNPSNRPFAELWLGAHGKAPAIVADNGTPLNAYIDESPATVLGPAVNARYHGKLPYLLKILDAHQMLSIQAHPNKHQAQEGFARENAAGIDLHAPERNYKDDNHKPEVHVALTEFWMLHGFRGPGEIARILDNIPEFRSGLANQSLPDLRELYRVIMTMPQSEVDRILDPLIARLHSNPPAPKDTPDYWALKAAATFPLQSGHQDRGIFSIYLLNLVHLQPGQGTFQPAGVLHAYLEGVNVELMANSDNVLRGGLTKKHIDVAELMRTVNFAAGEPEVLDGEAISDTEHVYRTAAEEFRLSRIDLPAGRAASTTAVRGPESILLLEGSATLTSGEQTLPLSPGFAVLVPFGFDYALESQGKAAVLFKAAVPG